MTRHNININNEKKSPPLVPSFFPAETGNTGIHTLNSNYSIAYSTRNNYGNLLLHNRVAANSFKIKF